MERTALRLATVAALLNGGNTPYPTVAGGYVYDSMMDDIVDVVPDKRRPIIVVRTDDDVSSYQAVRFHGRICRLLIEISVVTAARNADQTPRLEWPKTDPALEAFLDLMEWQVHIALFGYSDWALMFKERRYQTFDRFASTPRYSPPERGSVRLAVRTLEMQVHLAEECIPPMVKDYGEEVPPMLPTNFLYVFKFIMEHGTGEFRKAVLELYKTIYAYGLHQRPKAPPLQRVWMTDPDLEIEADWKIDQEAPLTADSFVGSPPIISQPVITGG